MPLSMQRKWKNRRATQSLMLYMKYWGVKTMADLMNTPIPLYLAQFKYMEKDLKEQQKQLKKQKSSMKSKGRR